MSLNKTFSTISKSHKSIEYQTPKYFFDKLNHIFFFKLDPCAAPENSLKLKIFFTEKEDGLKQDWDANTFINPPFGRNILEWVMTMKRAYERYQKTYVMLLPARTDTIWMQQNIVKTRNSYIHFIKGRLKFVNSEYNPKNQPHNIGSMLWILGASDEQIRKLNENVPGFTVMSNDIII